MKKQWTHKGQKGIWNGHHDFLQNYSRSERVFSLKNPKTGRILSFESWQQAKKLGWVSR